MNDSIELEKVSEVGIESTQGNEGSESPVINSDLGHIDGLEASAVLNPDDDDETVISALSTPREEKLLNPDHIPVIWSTSRADTANLCLRKYYYTYINKIYGSTTALTLGTQTHEFQAKVISDKIFEEAKLIELLDAHDKEIEEKGKGFKLDPTIYTFVPAMIKFSKNWDKIVTANNLEYKVECQYGCKPDGSMGSYFDDPTIFLRLVIDLWTYNKDKKQLFIVDHKTNKSKISANAMKKNEQLNLYVAALSKMFQLEWETATVALHFIRFGQVVPVNLRKDDVETFWKGYTEYLKLLDDKISEAEYLNSWPKEKGFQCKMCAFQPQCAGLGMGSFKGAGKGKSKAKGS